MNKIKTLTIFIAISSLIFITITLTLILSRNINATSEKKGDSLYEEGQIILNKIVKLPPTYMGIHDISSLELVKLTKQADDKYLEQVEVDKKLLNSPLTRLLPYYQSEYNSWLKYDIQRHETMQAYLKFYEENYKTNANEEKQKLLRENISLQEEKGKKLEKNISKDSSVSNLGEIVLKTPIAFYILVATTILGLFSLIGSFYLWSLHGKLLYTTFWFISILMQILFFYLLYRSLTSTDF
jgi:hypothetical protein